MGLLVALLLLGGESTGSADEKAACVEAHAKGQELRRQGRWIDAASSLRECAATTCPAPVVADCSAWCDELARSIPTVLIVAVASDGTETVDVRLYVDDRLVFERLPATSFGVDPGEHVIRLEHDGWPSVDGRFVVREGEKNHRVLLRFPRVESSELRRASIPTLGLVLLGIGTAGAVAGATSGVLGKVREDELAQSPCGRTGTCDPDDVDVVRRRYWTAGIAGGLGVAALVAGLVLVFRARTKDVSLVPSDTFTLKWARW